MKKIIFFFAAAVLLVQFAGAESEAYDYYFSVTSSSQTRGYCTLSLEYTELLSAYIGGVQMRGSIARHGSMLDVYCYPVPSLHGGRLSTSLGSLNQAKNKKTVTCDVTCTRFPLQCTDVTDYNFSCTLTESD